MKDIVFNPISRDLEFAENGDFLLTENPSTQNGGILLEARCMNILKPAFGIGFNSQILGGPRENAALQLNRWVSQVNADGGKAKWATKNQRGADFSFDASVNYL